MINNITRALIIKKEHLDKILSGDKVWEMRSTKTNVRGRIGLIESGSGLIVGEVEIVDVLTDVKPWKSMYRQYHQVYNSQLLYKWRYPWVLKNAKRYNKPIPYKHPKGAVVWVKL